MKKLLLIAIFSTLIGNVLSQDTILLYNKDGLCRSYLKSEIIKTITTSKPTDMYTTESILKVLKDNYGEYSDWYEVAHRYAFWNIVIEDPEYAKSENLYKINQSNGRYCPESTIYTIDSSEFIIFDWPLSNTFVLDVRIAIVKDNELWTMKSGKSVRDDWVTYVKNIFKKISADDLMTEPVIEIPSIIIEDSYWFQ